MKPADPKELKRADAREKVQQPPEHDQDSEAPRTGRPPKSSSEPDDEEEWGRNDGC